MKTFCNWFFVFILSLENLTAQQIFSTWPDPTGRFTTDRQPALLCGLGLCPTFTNPEAIADSRLDNFALIEFPALSVLGSASITVDLPETVTGSVGGIKVSSGTNLSVLSVLPSIEIALINNTTVVSSRVYATLASLLGLSSAEPTSLCTEPASASVQYNKIRFSVSVPVGVNSALQFSVYNAYANPPVDCNAFGVLPIRLGNAKAVVDQQCRVNLNWTTISEANTKEFKIERKAEIDNDWRLIEAVKAKGWSNHPVEYNVVEKYVANGMYFYRLQNIDRDGTSTYYNFNPVKVNCNAGKFSVYPTVTSDRIMVSLPANMINYQLVLRNVSGQTLPLNYQRNLQSFPLSVAHLPKGIYTLQLISGKSVETVKIVVQ